MGTVFSKNNNYQDLMEKGELHDNLLSNHSLINEIFEIRQELIALKKRIELLEEESEKLKTIANQDYKWDNFYEMEL